MARQHLTSGTSLALLALAVLLVSTVGAAVPTTDYDARLDSTQTVWRGQTLYFDGAAVVEATHDPGLRDVSTADRTFAVRRIRDNGTLGAVAETVELAADGTTVVHTSGLDGTYVLVYDGRAVAVDEGHGTLRGAVDEVNLTASAWTVTNDSDDIAARFDSVGDDEMIHLPQHRHALLAGQMNLPAGTAVTIRLHNGGDRPVLFSLETELGPNGRFYEQLDLTAVRHATQLNVSVSHDDRTLVTTTAVVDEVETKSTNATPTATATESTTASPNDDSPLTARLPGVSLAGAVVVAATAVVVLVIRRGWRIRR